MKVTAEVYFLIEHCAKSIHWEFKMWNPLNEENWIKILKQ